MNIKMVIASLLVLMSIGSALAEFSSERNLTLNVEGDVKGEGYYMAYNYARMQNAMGYESVENGVAAKTYLHGSGSIDSASIMNATSSEKKEGVIAVFDNGTINEDAYGLDYHEALANAGMKRTDALVYSPMTMSIGTGFFARNPITYSSLISDSAHVLNRGGVTSMRHSVDQAHGLDMDMNFFVENFISEDDPSTTRMDISEDVNQGRARLSILQGNITLINETDDEEDEDENGIDDDSLNIDFVRSAWKDPLIDIDEVFIGTFNIEKSMSITVFEEENEEEPDWLPCCSGGYDDMNYMDRIGLSADGIFDCSCFKVPATAEFQREY